VDETLRIADHGVRQLYARYADAVRRKDRALMESCFADDAVWKISGQVIEGREACGAFFAKAVAVSDIVTFWPGPIALDIVSGQVVGRLQATELIRRGDTAIRTLGIYYDRFAQRDGAWLFAWHHFDMVYFGPPDLSGTWLDAPDYGPPPGFPPDDAPTTVR
jgi:ketosteroid isomerase-like protein